MATTEKCYNNASNDGVSDDCVNDVDDSNTQCDDGDDEENDFQDNLFTVLNSIMANFDQLADNCCTINDKLNNIEMDCIDLLQPMTNIIMLERQLKCLSEIESNYMKALRERENESENKI